MKKIVTIVILLFAIPNVVFAECDTYTLEKAKKKANNIAFVIEEGTDAFGDPNLKITLTGMSDNFDYAYSILPNFYNNSNEYDGEAIIENVRPGATIVTKVYGKNECENQLLRTITVSTTPYNMYYNDPICDKAKNYRLCQKWTTVDLIYDDFIKSVQNYIDSNKTKIVPINKKDDFDLYNLFLRYYWFVLITLIGILGVLIYLWIKQNKKNQL